MLEVFWLVFTRSSELTFTTVLLYALISLKLRVHGDSNQAWSISGIEFLGFLTSKISYYWKTTAQTKKIHKEQNVEILTRNKNY